MTTIDQQDLDSVDLADPAVWDDGPPYELFARMQREAPVHFSPQRNLPDEGGFWSITRFDDVRAVSRDHRTFSSERRGIFHMDDIGVPLDMQRLQLISMDPPRHDRLKALVIKEFTPEAVGAHEDHVKQIISRVSRQRRRPRTIRPGRRRRAPDPGPRDRFAARHPARGRRHAGALDQRVHRVRRPGDPGAMERHHGGRQRDHRVHPKQDRAARRLSWRQPAHRHGRRRGRGRQAQRAGNRHVLRLADVGGQRLDPGDLQRDDAGVAAQPRAACTRCASIRS